MHATNLAGFDLNLLVALDALLKERSVTRAAQRVGLSQPAMSHALRRLRDELGDAILVREGRRMVPTPRGERLRAPLQRLLAETLSLLRDEGDFDPQRSTRMFSLVCPDVLALVLPALLEAMSAQAPGVRLDVLSAPGPDLALAGDLWLGPAPVEGAGLMSRTLGRVSWAVVGRAGHPGFQGRFSVKKWTAYPHIQVVTGDLRPSFVELALAEAGIERTVGLTVPSFLAAIEIIPWTDHFFAAVRELIEGKIEMEGHLALKRPPIPLPDVPVAGVWHERLHTDVGHRWFRETVFAEVGRILGRKRAALPR